MPTPPSARETSLCGEPPTDPFYLSRKSKSALVPGTYDNSPRGTLIPSPPYLRLSQQPHVNQPPPTAHTHCSIARDRTSGLRPFAIPPTTSRAGMCNAAPVPPQPTSPCALSRSHNPHEPSAVRHGRVLAIAAAVNARRLHPPLHRLRLRRGSNGPSSRRRRRPATPSAQYAPSSRSSPSSRG